MASTGTITISSDAAIAQQPNPRLRRRIIISLLAAAALIQVLSATFVRSDFATPNASTHIARYMAATGTYGLTEWHRLKGADEPYRASGPMRMFQLPAEPLYQYAFLRAAPPFLQRYSHIPFVLALIVSVFLVAETLLGTARAAIAAMIVALHPFVIVHGPVWDDTTMAAACEWVCLALLIVPAAAGSSRVLRGGVLFAAAAIAALARTQSQALLAAVALLIVVVPALRSRRREALAMLAGVALAVAAWGLRNYEVAGEFFTGTTHDGITLYESNYLHEHEALVATGQTEGLDSRYMQADFARTARLSELFANRYFTARGIDAILHRPHRAWLRDSLFKLAASLFGFHPELALSNPRNLLQVVPNAILLLISGFGLFFFRRVPHLRDVRRWVRAHSLHSPQPPRAIFITAALLIAAITVAMLLIGPVGFRYQLSMLGLYAIAAAGLWPARTGA